jgi:protein-disulfide isomerase
MYKLFIFALLLSTSLLANDLKTLQYKTSIKSVQSIQQDAIIYGSGDRNVYVFIDPWCRYSRKFISMVTNNHTMLTKYKYHLYLYGIPRLHSQNAIAAVYRAKRPLKTLLKIMIEDDKTTSPLTSKVKAKISAIKTVAQQLKVNKRPFLIIEK